MVRRDKIRVWSKRLTASACSPWRWIERFFYAILAFRMIGQLSALGLLGAIIAMSALNSWLGHGPDLGKWSLGAAFALMVVACIRILLLQLEMRLVGVARMLCYVPRAIWLARQMREELDAPEIGWRLVLSLINVERAPTLEHRGAYEGLVYLTLIALLDKDVFNPDERAELGGEIEKIRARFSRRDPRYLRVFHRNFGEFGPEDREDIADLSGRYDHRHAHDEGQAKGYREAGVRADPDGGTHAHSSAGVIMLVIVESVDVRKERV